jgi:hypothetical protein
MTKRRRIQRVDEWAEFRSDDSDPIGIEELRRLDLSRLPKGVHIHVLDDYFPETTISREGASCVCEIREHLYTKYWEHKFSAYAFAEAMERAVLRLAHEGHPLARPRRDDEDVHIFINWQLRLPSSTSPDDLVASIKAAFDLVWSRADAILEDSDSVLVLGKDTGAAFARLKAISSRLQELGYHTYIVKEQPDRFGEGVIQKVLRFALSSKFVIIENTHASGHLYEIPHVTKAAECVTAVLQEQGKGATWMFEDAYEKHRHWRKFTYKRPRLDTVVDQAVKWAELFVRNYGKRQMAVLPWSRKK